MQHGSDHVTMKLVMTLQISEPDHTSQAVDVECSHVC